MAALYRGILLLGVIVLCGTGSAAFAQTAEETFLFLITGVTDIGKLPKKGDLEYRLTQPSRCVYAFSIESKSAGTTDIKRVDLNAVSVVSMSTLGEAIDGLHVHFQGDKPVCNFMSVKGILVEIPPCSNEVWFNKGELKIDPNYVTSDRLIKAGEFLRQKFCKGIAF